MIQLKSNCNSFKHFSEAFSNKVVIVCGFVIASSLAVGVRNSFATYVRWGPGSACIKSYLVYTDRSGSCDGVILEYEMFCERNDENPCAGPVSQEPQDGSCMEMKDWPVVCKVRGEKDLWSFDVFWRGCDTGDGSEVDCRCVLNPYQPPQDDIAFAYDCDDNPK
jgi:hypothetical protein